MKINVQNSVVFVFMLFVCSGLYAASGNIPVPPKDNDTIRKLRKEQREQEKSNLKYSHMRGFIKTSLVFAKLRTAGSFSGKDDLVSANISLEDNLGLPDKSIFFTGSIMYRFTPRSGLYVEYYGLNRRVSHTTTEELIFMRDTIPAGTEGSAFFNTQVISIGYLLSILKDPNAFLGVYFNAYGMLIETGFSADHSEIDPNLKFVAPLPSFGIVALFRLTKWLQLHGDIGFFSLQLDIFRGSIYTFDIALDFKPVRWLGITISYQSFNVDVYIPSNEINTTINYNFRGPAFGLSFVF
jgi:hypothetical protein